MRSGKSRFLWSLILIFTLLLTLLLSIGLELYPSQGRAYLNRSAQEFHATGLLLAVLVIIGAAKFCGRLMKMLGQPPVMGEVLAGLALGPSILGRMAPEATAWLFPEQLLGVLNYLAQLGIILFMFLVGIEFDSHSLRHKTRETLAISFSSMASPFLLGIALAMSIYQSHAPAAIDFLRFSLFLGAAMSVTAFPVLVRIIKDLRLESHDFAILAISCAALDDALAWCLLAVVVSVSQGQASQVLTQVLGIGIFLLIQYTLVRPFIGYMERKAELLGLHGEILPLMFCLAFVSAIITEKLGVHALFGAFVLGSLVSHDSRMAREIQEKTASILNVIFIPLFFAQAGLKTQLTLLASWDAIALLGLVLGLATVGKIGGTYIASVYVCPDKHDALALSVLMNTRGLMEIIVLSVGMQLGIIDSYLFTIFVSMAILTTLMTAPLLKWILHRRSIGIS